MDFELSEEQKVLQGMAYKFALKEFDPIARSATGGKGTPGRSGKKPARPAWWG